MGNFCWENDNDRESDAQNLLYQSFSFCIVWILEYSKATEITATVAKPFFGASYASCNAVT